MKDLEDSNIDEQRRVEEIYARLIQVIVESEVEALHGPHIVICRSRGTGVIGYTGPYPSGMAALLAAEREAQLVDDDVDLEFAVAQLMSPIESV